MLIKNCNKIFFKYKDKFQNHMKLYLDFSYNYFIECSHLHTNLSMIFEHFVYKITSEFKCLQI